METHSFFPHTFGRKRRCIPGPKSVLRLFPMLHKLEEAEWKVGDKPAFFYHKDGACDRGRLGRDGPSTDGQTWGGRRGGTSCK